MATKRKMRRYNGGGMPQYDDAEGVDAAVAANTDTGEWARGENYGDNTTPDERVAQARAPRREATAEEIEAITPKTPEESTKQTFKQAFAAARSAGDKTFEWEGKKYTTQLASSAGAGRGGQGGASAAQAAKSAPVKPKTEAAPAPKKKYEYESAMDKMVRERREKLATNAETDRLANRYPARGTSESRGQNRILRDLTPGKVNPKTLLPMKKGGLASASSRADGIAKRGKTRGTMR